MTWPWPPALTDAIDAAAIAAYPREACGVVVEDGGVLRARVGRNVAADPRAFDLDPALLFAVRRDEQTIVGIFHSHCNTPPAPSAADRASARGWPDVLHAIVRVDQGRVTDRRVYRWRSGDLR